MDEWRCRPLTCEYPYVYIDGIYLKRSWGGSYENVAVMVASMVLLQADRDVWVGLTVSLVNMDAVCRARQT